MPPNIRERACLQAEAWALAGTQVTWTNHEPASTLCQWYRAGTRLNPGALPNITGATMMVCFELPMIAAAMAGSISARKLWELYDAHWSRNKSWDSILQGSWTSSTYNVKLHRPVPKKGDIVFFNGLAHVAIATGNRNRPGEIVSVWGMDTTGLSANTDIEITSSEALYASIQQQTARLSVGGGVGATSPLGNTVPPLVIKFANPPW